MNHPLHSSPSLRELQRRLSSLRIEVPEAIANDLDRAFNTFIAEITRHADLDKEFRCVRCSTTPPWLDNKWLQIGNTRDKHRIVDQMCPRCYEELRPQRVSIS